MLLQLIGNQHAHQSSYTENIELSVIMLSKHLFTIINMICHFQTKQQSNVLFFMLAVYLVESEMKCCVIEMLSELRICYNYH